VATLKIVAPAEAAQITFRRSTGTVILPLRSCQERMSPTRRCCAAWISPLICLMERSSISMKAACSRKRSSKACRASARSVPRPPSAGCRAVRMSGARSFGIARSTSSKEWRRRSSRSSNKSGGRQRRVAVTSADAEAITATTRDPDIPSLTRFAPIMYNLPWEARLVEHDLRSRHDLLPCLPGNRN